jgi:hypothetical protein
MPKAGEVWETLYLRLRYRVLAVDERGVNILRQTDSGTMHEYLNHADFHRQFRRVTEATP